jgi:hypothetical protein
MVFYRNTGVHGLDRSMKKRLELYGLPGLSIMLISTLPRLSSSLMLALHRRGYFLLANTPRPLK